MKRRPRVLLIAESANPEWASVPLVGWGLSRALLGAVDGHVVTQIRNREAIERTGWREGSEFTALDSERIAAPFWAVDSTLRRMTGLGWTTAMAFNVLPYYYFEHLVWRRFGEAIRAHQFDIVHRVTPLSPTLPSLLARRCREAGVPFVWGPVNGGVEWPSQFSGLRWKEGEWLSYVRRGHRLLPRYRSSRTDAAAILVGSEATWREFSGYHDRCVYIPENGIDLARFPDLPPRPVEPPLRIAFVGRLVPYKGADMLIDAVAPMARANDALLDILGDGPEMEALRRQVSQAGLQEVVRLPGWVNHPELARRLARAHVFAFPSIREFGGAVVLEAMAMGLVPVVVDHGGPGEIVTEATGFRVPVMRRVAIVQRFREILTALAREPASLGPLAARARRRARTLYTWEAKVRQVIEVYRWVLSERDKPDFGMPFPESSEEPERSDCGSVAPSTSTG